MKKIIENYEKGKSPIIKLVALSIKAVAGIVGGSLILNQEHPYWALAVLGIGAVANEIINFYSGLKQS